MKLRWKHGKGTPPPGAIMIGDNTWQVLQQWIYNVRTGECAGIDYSEDGEWIDIEATQDD